jgi:hypothetical protein
MEVLESLGDFFIGVGLMLLGVAAIWFVSIYAEKSK